MNNKPEKPMTCKQAELTMGLHISNDRDMPEKRRLAYESHLENCPKCLKEYQESEFIIELSQQYWPMSDETVVLIEQSGQNYKPRMSVEEGWKDLCRRCPELGDKVNRRKERHLIFRIFSVAVCLIIGLLMWLVFSSYSKRHTSSENTSPITKLALASVRIELISKTGDIYIPAGRKIVSGNELKSLLINGKHQMMMNAGTSLSIEPLLANIQLGILVKLTAGEIYTRVEHDGNPFVVETYNGKAVISGTTFNIKFEGNNTTLVVTEGTVKFESENGEVNVEAGQLSEILGNAIPTEPVTCNTDKIKGWATMKDDEEATAQIETGEYDLSHPEMSVSLAPGDLERINYENWIEENKEWFKSEFPHIFKLQEALAQEGIEAVYPDLLMKTGDIWQFVNPEYSATQIPVPNQQSLLKACTLYGFNEKWLSEKIDVNYPISTDKSFGSEAFEKWQAVLDKAVKDRSELSSRKWLYSLHASVYLSKSRTLAWLMIKNNLTGHEIRDKSRLLRLFENQVNSSSLIFQTSTRLVICSASGSKCTDEEYMEMLIQTSNLVNQLYENEKKIGDYEQLIPF